jgi:hypothetical protein
MTIHYHGTPITPVGLLKTLRGRSFCVSYFSPDQIDYCVDIGESVLIDNGAYTFHTKYGKGWMGQEYLAGYCAFAKKYSLGPNWCLIPDVIDGTELENDRLIEEYGQLLPNSYPVWHVSESIERLVRLSKNFSKVCFGSSGAYFNLNTDKWVSKVEQAFDAVCDKSGRCSVWVHMLRGMNLSKKSAFPFCSVDSTDIARNHSRNKLSPGVMAEFWGGNNNSLLWRPK